MSNRIDELEAQEKPLWEVVQQTKQVLRDAEAAWYVVRKQIIDLREQERIDAIVETELAKRIKKERK